MVFTRAHAQAHASCEARFTKTLHFLHWLNQRVASRERRLQPNHSYTRTRPKTPQCGLKYDRKVLFFGPAG